MDPVFEALVQERVTTAVNEAQNNLLSSLDQMMSAKLDQMESKISENQQKLSDNQLSKIQTNISTNDGYVFKRKSCEDQFKFNVKVIDKLQDAEAILEKNGDLASISAREKVSEGKDLLQQRQKLVKLADESEHGWKTVHEYQTNPLADDSGDEKRMLRAEARANRKIKQERLKRSRRRFSPYIPYGSQRWSATATNQQMKDQPASGGQKPGLCFLCRKPGHWKKDCELATNPNNKLSTLDFCLDNCVQENVLQNVENEHSNNFHFGKGGKKVAEQQTPLNETEGKAFSLESPIGRLKVAQEKWRQSGANNYIMRVVSEGYAIPFKELPPSKVMSNNKSARDNIAFVKEEVSKLLLKGVF